VDRTEVETLLKRRAILDRLEDHLAVALLRLMLRCHTLVDREGSGGQSQRENVPPDLAEGNPAHQR
jgi:hypothetical protein